MKRQLIWAAFLCGLFSSLSAQTLDIYYQGNVAQIKARNAENTTWSAQGAHVKVKSLQEEDENIRYVYGKILLAHHEMHRGNMSQQSLDDLAQTMTAVDYDEDRMAKLLHQHKLDQFLGRLEQVMMELSTLTEGFITLPPIQDKQTEQMKKSITHYQQPTITTD